MESRNDARIEYSSFRDPAGLVFQREGVLYRQVNPCYQAQYRSLMESGLYELLVKQGWLIPHKETGEPGATEESALVLRPERVPFISYPYEWSFGMLKDAALLTLHCHRAALDHGMILKDASAYNVQFRGGRPVLIDTLSFDFYRDGTPWVAYGQFCRHFIAPLILMSQVDLRLNQLMRVYIDGIPLDLASKLMKGKGGFFAKQHIHWHARATEKHAGDGRQPGSPRQIRIKKENFVAMIDSMIRGVESLSLGKATTEWGEYYLNTNYSASAAAGKKALVTAWLEQLRPQTLWDIGANDGSYSRLALSAGASVVALDIDMLAVERNYCAVKTEGLDMLPLLMDLTNPSPAIGFSNQERMAMNQRPHPQCILALAVIHHLAISNNLPLGKIAGWLSGLAQELIIEFVPKEDSQVRVLLATRDDIFPGYTQEGFAAAFQEYFAIVREERIPDSQRTLYWMRAKQRISKQ